MIDYRKLVEDKNYFNSELANIATIDDSRILADELKMLSQNLYDGKIDSDNAKKVLAAIKNRQAILSGKTRFIQNTNYNNNHNDGGHSMKLMPKNRSTSVSNRIGTISVVFIIINIVVTIVMYALLAFAQFIK